MALKAKHEQQPVIPTASMADIAFLLIVFFMVTITFEKDKTQVSLPQTELRFEVPKEAAYVSITSAGQIRVTDGEDTSVPIQGLQDVDSFASNLAATYPDRPVVLKADADVEYRYVDEVIDSLKQSKVKLIYLLSDQKTVE
ncbi:MAG: biopolymer transporter ExbD [Acidobacteriota bacterium]